jgi:hypothetical protein
LLEQRAFLLHWALELKVSIKLYPSNIIQFLLASAHPEISVQNAFNCNTLDGLESSQLSTFNRKSWSIL